MKLKIHSWKHDVPAAWLVCLVFCTGLAAQAHEFNADALKPGVVRMVLLMDGAYGSGSGFVVHSENDYCIVATNYHVVAQSTEPCPIYAVRKVREGIEVRKGEVIYRDDQRDLALVKVPGLKAPQFTLSGVEPVQGEEVYSIGFPGVADDKQSSYAVFKIVKDGNEGAVTNYDQIANQYIEPSVERGVVRRVVMGAWEHLAATMKIKLIQTDVNGAHGNSGGPLFNAIGHVVGVDTAGLNTPDAGRFAISSYSGNLIDVLKQQNITFTESDEPAPIPAVPIAVAAGSGGSGSGISSWSLVLVTGTAAFALLLAVRKRQVLAGSYSHFIRRSAQPGQAGNSLVTTARREASGPAALAPGGHCVLEGNDPEARSAIRLVVTEALWSKAGERILIGRNVKQAHLCIRNRSVSGQHLSLLRLDGKFLIEDRDSSNGTSINEKRLVPYAPVHIEDGDMLKVGDVLLRFRRV